LRVRLPYEAYFIGTLGHIVDRDRAAFRSPQLLIDIELEAACRG